MEYSMEFKLRKRHGLPKDIDLTAYLGGTGTWHVLGWQLANTDEVDVFYNTLGSGGFILVVKRLGGLEARQFILESLDEVEVRAKEFLTPKDMSRLHFALSRF